MKPTLHLPQVLHTLQQERANCITALHHQNDDASALAYKQQLDAAIACLSGVNATKCLATVLCKYCRFRAMRLENMCCSKPMKTAIVCPSLFTTDTNKSLRPMQVI